MSCWPLPWGSRSVAVSLVPAVPTTPRAPAPSGWWLSEGSGGRAPLPDHLPLRPLAVGERGVWGAVQPRRQHRAEAVADEAFQLGGGEEVDVEPGLGTAAVADGEAAVAGRLGALVLGAGHRFRWR